MKPEDYNRYRGDNSASEPDPTPAPAQAATNLTDEDLNNISIIVNEAVDQRLREGVKANLDEPDFLKHFELNTSELRGVIERAVKGAVEEMIDAESLKAFVTSCVAEELNNPNYLRKVQFDFRPQDIKDAVKDVVHATMAEEFSRIQPVRTQLSRSNGVYEFVKDLYEVKGRATGAKRVDTVWYIGKKAYSAEEYADITGEPARPSDMKYVFVEDGKVTGLATEVDYMYYEMRELPLFVDKSTPAPAKPTSKPAQKPAPKASSKPAPKPATPSPVENPAE